MHISRQFVWKVWVQAILPWRPAGAERQLLLMRQSLAKLADVVTKLNRNWQRVVNSHHAQLRLLWELQVSTGPGVLGGLGGVERGWGAPSKLYQSSSWAQALPELWPALQALGGGRDVGSGAGAKCSWGLAWRARLALRGLLA